MANDCIPWHRPGEDLTGHCTAGVTGKRVLRISANMASSPGALASTAEGANIKVAHCDGTQHTPFGVSKYDAANGGKVGIIREGVVPITCGADITAGQKVMANASGQVIPWVGPTTTNAAALPQYPICVGVAVADATNGNDCYVALQLT